MKSVIASMSVAVALVACGGGGDVTPAPEPTPTPATLHQGLYAGSNLNFMDLTGSPSTALALEGGEVWALLGGNGIVFFYQGTVAYTSTTPGITTTTTTTTNTTPPTSTIISSTTTADVAIFNQSKALVALKSNVLGEDSITVGQSETPYGKGMSVSTATQTQFVLAGGRERLPETGYDYNKPANLQDVAGVWGTNHDGSSYLQAIPLAVDTSGGITAPVQSSGCSLVGTITPRPSGKNVFNLHVTLTGCADAGEYAGVAVNYMDGAGYSGSGPFVIPTFRLIAINSDKTKVFEKTTARSS